MLACSGVPYTAYCLYRYLFVPVTVDDKAEGHRDGDGGRKEEAMVTCCWTARRSEFQWRVEA